MSNNARRPLSNPFAAAQPRVQLPPRPGAPIPEPVATPELPTLPGRGQSPITPSYEEPTWADETVVEDEVAVDEEPEVEYPPLTPEQDLTATSFLLAHSTEQPLSLLFNLASDTNDWQVRDTLARNPALPYEIFEVLTQDPESLVRRSLVRNSSLPADLYARLTEDADPLVLLAVIDYPRTDVDTLTRLAGHEDLVVAESAVIELERILADVA